MEPWTKKYLPKSTEDIVGQKSPLELLKECINKYKFRKKRAIILYGPTGCGKTSSVHGIAKENSLEIVELNASDVRNKDSVTSIVKAAGNQQSLFSKGKVILLDEIDGLSSTKDRGGISALAAILNKTNYPIVMTAVDPFHKKFTPLRKKSEMVQFKPLSYLSIISKLKLICENESIEYNDEDIKSLAMRAGGDLRGAITDLQILTINDNKLDKDALDELSGRSRVEKIHSALIKIFKSTNPDVSLPALNNVDEPLDKVILWIDENLPKEYKKPLDLKRAYDCLSKADIFWRRIRRWQHWHYLVYINTLLSLGVAMAKDEKYPGFYNYQPTKRILKLWQAKMKYKLRNAIAEKVANECRTSKKTAINDILPYLKIMSKNDFALGDALATNLDLDEQEIEWVRS
jgi:replication factor C large subunit